MSGDHSNLIARLKFQASADRVWPEHPMMLESATALAALVAERDALLAEVAELKTAAIMAKPLYSRRKLEVEHNGMRKALGRISRAKATGLDLGMDTLVLERAIKIAADALSETSGEPSDT